jgi:hypothetical protein
MMCDGIAAELSGIDLGDKRLNQRSVTIFASSAKPVGDFWLGEIAKSMV